MPHLEKHCRKCGVWSKHLSLDYLILGALFCVLKRRLGSVTAKNIYILKSFTSYLFINNSDRHILQRGGNRLGKHIEKFDRIYLFIDNIALFFLFTKNCFFTFFRTLTGIVKSFHVHSSKAHGMDFGGLLFR